MRRTRRFSEVLGYCRSSVALGDPGTVDVWRRPVDLSLCSIVQQIFVFFLLALSFFPLNRQNGDQTDLYQRPAPD
jgi:hypothetical protein